jgi:hypothetical protein
MRHSPSTRSGVVDDCAPYESLLFAGERGTDERLECVRMFVGWVEVGRVAKVLRVSVSARWV